MSMVLSVCPHCVAVAVFIRFWKVLAVACLAVRFCTITVGHSAINPLLSKSNFLKVDSYLSFPIDVSSMAVSPELLRIG